MPAIMIHPSIRVLKESIFVAESRSTSMADATYSAGAHYTLPQNATESERYLDEHVLGVFG